MQDAEYLRLIEHIRENILEFGQQLGAIQQQWVAVTGYAAPFGLIDLNLALSRIINDLEMERAEVGTEIRETFMEGMWKNRIIH
jgi:flagellar biosynthesis protein FlhB